MKTLESVNHAKSLESMARLLGWTDKQLKAAAQVIVITQEKLELETN